MATAAEYLISLKDGMSGPASAAEGALRKLESTIQREVGALAGMESKLASASARLSELQSGFGGKVDIAAVTRAKNEVEKLNAAIAGKKEGIGRLKEAAPGYEKLAASAKQAASAQAEHATKMQGFADAAKGAKGATEGAGSAVDKLSDKMPQLDGNLGKVQQALSKLGPAGAVIAAAFTVIVIATTALIGTLYKLASAAIAISQEKDALANTFKALSTGAESGRELVDSISEVAAALPFAEGQTLSWAKSLMSAGIEGEVLKGRLLGVASAAALMNAEGGAAAENFFKQLAAGGDAADALIKTVQSGGKKAAVALSAMGLQSKDLAAALGKTPEQFGKMKLTADQLGDALQKALIQKGAKSLEAMSLTWTSITAKLGDAWEDLFEDLGSAVSPFMAEVKALFAEFSAGGTAQGLTKSLLVSFLTTLFSVATKVTHAIHLGFLQVEIAMLKVYIFMAPVINAFRALLGSTAFLTGLGTMLKVIGIALVLIGGPLFAITAAFWAFGTAVFAVVGMVIGALTWCVGDAARAGSAIVSGLVNGITAGAGFVVDAMKSLGNAAIGAFKSVLGIHSPSSVMRLQGQFTAEGASLGIDDGAADVEASAGAMAKGAADAGSGSGAGGRSSGGSVVNHYNITCPAGTPQSTLDFVLMGIEKAMAHAANAEPMPEGA
jgi:hypothetical protein